MKTNHTYPCGLASLFYFLLSTFAFSQGSLTPPGAPTPTMKSLDQIEPRKEINATNTLGDASNHFIITQPGSYFLSAGFTTTGTKNGINIQADDVSLDLRGFAIVGTGASGGKGIVVTSTHKRLRIYNGTVRNALIGIDAATALDSSFEHLALANNAGNGLTTGAGALVDSCHASDNTLDGINVASRSVVRNCAATGNDGTAGIVTGSGCTVSHCTGSNNDNASGISLSPGSVAIGCVTDNNAGNGITVSPSDSATIKDCSASSNTSTGISAGNRSQVINCTVISNGSNGITVGGVSVVSGCQAFQNTGIGINANGTIFGCSVSGNGAQGIKAFAGFSTVSNCTASSNVGNGIQLEGQSLAINNTALNNGAAGGTGAGILSNDADDRIEGNNVTGNDTGIQVTGTGCLIIRNSASGNTTSNYDIVAGNKVGPIVLAPDSVAITGDTGGAGVGTTNPWSNLTF